MPQDAKTIKKAVKKLSVAKKKIQKRAHAGYPTCGEMEDWARRLEEVMGMLEGMEVQENG